MIGTILFNECKYGSVEYEATKYVNRNIIDITRYLLELMQDGTIEISDFFPIRSTGFTDNEVIQMMYDLIHIAKSSIIRDEIKPKYQYLLLKVLEWWEDMCEEGVQLPYEVDEKLKTAIIAEYEEEDEGEGLIETISDPVGYQTFMFHDYDFLPEFIETLFYQTLQSGYIREGDYSILEFSEYRELMPIDLREMYDDVKLRAENKIAAGNDIYDDIIFCCERIQASTISKSLDEDEINDNIRNLLEAKGYNVKDQTRQGSSLSGKKSGEVDILIKDENMPITLVEAMKLKSIDKKYIGNHIEKIFKYDTLGYGEIFLVSYIETKDFDLFWDKYKEYVCKYDHEFRVIGWSGSGMKQYPELRSIVVEYNRNGISTKLYHIGVHLQ